MGGGDLNTKKSWHPNTMKNQERVWKAEQAQAHEKQRIDDLRREMDSERSREELTSQGQASGVLTHGSNKKMDWMYKQPNEGVDREQYLLGKAVDKTFEKIVSNEQSNQSYIKAPPKNHVEHECIPFSIRNLSGQVGPNETQVDMARKLLEDPLVAIRKRELESRAQLLQNPVKLKELTMLLKADQGRSMKKKLKKKKKKKDYDLDNKLAEKLDKLKSAADSGLSINELLLAKHSKNKSHKKKKKKRHSSVSDSDSEAEIKESKKHKKSKKRQHDSSSDSDEEDKGRKEKTARKDKSSKHEKHDTRQSSSSRNRQDEENNTKRSHDKYNYSKYDDNVKNKSKLYEKDKYTKYDYSEKKQKKNYESENHSKYGDNVKKPKVPQENDNYSKYDHKYREDKPKNHHFRDDEESTSQTKSYGLVKADGTKIQLNHKSSHSDLAKKTIEPSTKKWEKPQRKRLNEDEMEEKRREMMKDATKRDRQREKYVSDYRAQEKRSEAKDKSTKYKEDFVEEQLRIAAKHGSVESRIKSNIYNIQRSHNNMDSNFVKR